MEVTEISCKCIKCKILTFIFSTSVYQVAYSVTSPVLSDSSKYPYFARTIESTALHNPAILKILKLYDWKKVATISQVSEFVIGVSICVIIL